MTVFVQQGYTTPIGQYGLKHARILHAGNYLTVTDTDALPDTSDPYIPAPIYDTTYERWSISGASGSWTATTASGDCDTVCIAGHNFHTITTVFTVAVRVAGVWVDVLTDATVTDGSPIMVIFNAGGKVTGYRVSVTGSGSAFAVCRAGYAMSMPQMIYGGVAPTKGNRNITRTVNNSETGVFLGATVMRTSMSCQYQWQHIKTNWIEANWYSFMRAADTNAFFVAWRPDQYKASRNDVDYVLSASFDAPAKMGVGALMTCGFSGEVYSW